MCGRPGIVYSIQWFEQFAEQVMPGLQFCGLIYEGQSVDMCKTLPSGGVAVLDVSVYWLLPSGETTCCSARPLPNKYGLLDWRTRGDGHGVGVNRVGSECVVAQHSMRLGIRFLQELGARTLIRESLPSSTRIPAQVDRSTTRA